jgi:hypothetical protein
MPVGSISRRAHSKSIGKSHICLRHQRFLYESSLIGRDRSRYVILSGGYLITFKIKKKQAFRERKKVFSLFGSYCYSGQMAHDELHEQADQDAFARHPRVYHDGLQVRRASSR